MRVVFRSEERIILGSDCVIGRKDLVGLSRDNTVLLYMISPDILVSLHQTYIIHITKVF
jgi:hypothetical protein